MKKMIFLMMALLMLSCSTNDLQDEIITTNAKANVEKGKPTNNIECNPDYVFPSDANRDYIVYVLNGGYFEDYKQFEVYYHNYYKTLIFNEFLWQSPYNGIQYNFSIYAEDGTYLESGCVIQQYLLRRYYLSKKYKSGTYTVKFDDYPEVTRIFEFTID